jgi:cell division protein FtsB
MMESRKWINSVIVFSTMYLLFSGNRGLWNLYKLHQEKKDLSEQVFLLKGQIDRYQIEYKIFLKNTAVFEKQAREELNLVKPGELVYKFQDDNEH